MIDTFRLKLRIMEKKKTIQKLAPKVHLSAYTLGQQISNKKPTDPDFRDLLNELFQCELDESVSIVSPFYCDNGCRVKFGKNITINKGATFLSPGIIEIEDDVLIGPDVKIATVNHDLKDRHHQYYFKKVNMLLFFS